MQIVQLISQWRYARKHAQRQDAVEYHYQDLPLPRSKRYQGKLYYIDPVSRKRRPATPEEKVRQRIVLFLHYDLGIPYEAMEIEVSLGRFWKRATGRMDIVVYAADRQRKRPILVVECKAEHIMLSEQVYRQVDNYAVTLDIPFVAITNGNVFSMDQWNRGDHTYRPMKQIPSYAGLCALAQAGETEAMAADCAGSEAGDIYRRALRDGILGAQTPQLLADALLSLHQCWMDDDTPTVERDDWRDCGVYWRRTGAARGHSRGFRHFCVKKENGGFVDAYLCICAPKLPNVKKGPTYLEVYLGNDFTTPALRLKAEEFMITEKKRIHLWHDGRLNIGGRSGAVPRHAVLDRLRQCAPELLDAAGRVDLGTVSMTPQLRMDGTDMAQMCDRLIRYAIIRTEYRCNLRQNATDTSGT